MKIQLQSLIDTKDYTDEAKMQIIEATKQEYPIPVIIGFDHDLQIGIILSVKKISGQLIADIEIEESVNIHALRAEIGGYIKKAHYVSGVMVIEDIELKEISFNIKT